MLGDPAFSSKIIKLKKNFFLVQLSKYTSKSTDEIVTDLQIIFKSLRSLHIYIYQEVVYEFKSTYFHFYIFETILFKRFRCILDISVSDVVPSSPALAPSDNSCCSKETYTLLPKDTS